MTERKHVDMYTTRFLNFYPGLDCYRYTYGWLAPLIGLDIFFPLILGIFILFFCSFSAMI